MDGGLIFFIIVFSVFVFVMGVAFEWSGIWEAERVMDEFHRYLEEERERNNDSKKD